MDLFKTALWNHICAHFREHMFRWKSSKEKIFDFGFWKIVLMKCEEKKYD